jgi:hypothetical protein
MTTSLTLLPTIVNDDPSEPCGQDCCYLNGACRCHHGESILPSLSEPVTDDLEPPF